MDFLLELPATLIVFALGASVGSFLNVVIYRLPAGLSLLHPPSRCPKCLHRLRKHENVPVLGWFWLKGRCAHCKTPISARYPLVEGATGILFVLSFWMFGWSWQTIGYWFFLSWLLSLSLIDLDTMTLPNPLTQSGLVAGLVFQAVSGYLTTSTLAGSLSQLMQGIGGAVLGLWLLDLITIAGTFALGQAAMGGGDAKLSSHDGGLVRLEIPTTRRLPRLRDRSLCGRRGDRPRLAQPPPTHALWSLPGIGISPGCLLGTGDRLNLFEYLFSLSIKGRGQKGIGIKVPL
ncbi:prepilin peptidase [Kovacikia minuta]|uniref:prepilin peptidase n=1 Tax=Kovacikia minuta TaxID=2931930 RepID=UPI0036F2C60B